MLKIIEIFEYKSNILELGMQTIFEQRGCPKSQPFFSLMDEI